MTCLATLDPRLLTSIASRLESLGKMATLYLQNSVLEIMAYNYERVQQSKVTVVSSDLAVVHVDSSREVTFPFRTKHFVRAVNRMLARSNGFDIDILAESGQLFLSCNGTHEHVPNADLLEQYSIAVDVASPEARGISLDYEATKLLYSLIKAHKWALVTQTS